MQLRFRRKFPEPPRLTMADTSRHESFPKMQFTALFNVELRPLPKAGFREWDDGLQEKLKFCAASDPYLVALDSQAIPGRMNLRGGLLCNPHLCSPFHANRALHLITTKQSSRALHQDHLGNQRARPQDTRDLKGYFAIGTAKNRPAVFEDKCQFHPTAPADVCEWNTHVYDSKSSSLRIHLTTRSTPSRVLRFVNTKGFALRIVLESRSITVRSAPTYGARSILLMTRRSERVIPGPPLRGTLSTPATSMT